MVYYWGGELLRRERREVAEIRKGGMMKSLSLGGGVESA